MKKFIGMTAALFAIAFTASQYSGCSKSTPVSASATDQQFFATVAGGNDATTHDIPVNDQDALNDGAMYTVSQQPMPPSIQSVAGDDRMHPGKWGRYITGAERVITKIDLQGDSVAIVTVQVTYHGTFVVAGTLNGLPDTVRKPYTETLHRLFRFVRIASTDEPRKNWKLDAVAILNGGTGSPSISIMQMQMIPPTGDILVATDPDAYFMHVSKGWLHDLPLWGIDIQVTVNATVHSMLADTDFVTLHYAPKSFGLHRTAMTMVSQTGDAVAGYTRMYSATFVIPGNDKKIGHLLISATTHASLFSTADTDFASVVWGLPYKTSE